MVELDQFAQAFLEAAPDAVVGVDDSGRIVLVNAQVELLLGYTRHELYGETVERLVPARHRSTHAGWRSRFQEAPQRRPMASHALELTALRRDSTEVPVEITLAPVVIEGRTFTIAVLRDLTERRRLEDNLLYLSTHDALTGLVNRGAFDEALTRLDERGPHPVGVLMVDLDDLKRVNDERGHAAGDAMLRRVAQVLKATFRADDVVARIGGDEFAVLTAGRDAEAVQVLGSRLAQAVEQHNLEHGPTRLSLSIGVAIAESGMSVATALQDADARMYSMKRTHHSR